MGNLGLRAWCKSDLCSSVKLRGVEW